MAQRDVFGELMEGVTAMNQRREGKLTLRSYKIDPAPLPKVRGPPVVRMPLVL